ncbi:MAG: hypothetical protein SGPRY_009965, partial [Prymnesium sp.]
RVAELAWSIGACAGDKLYSCAAWAAGVWCWGVRDSGVSGGWGLSRLILGVRRALASPEAAGLLARGKSGRDEVENLEVQDGHRQGVVGGRPAGHMPSHWDERADVLAGRADGERARELQYISRRRSEPEDAGPEGTPEGKIALSQLYHGGVHDEIRGLVRRISNGLKSAEMELAMRGAVGCEVPRITSTPFGEEAPPEQRVDGEFFRAWADRLGWRDNDMLQQVVLTGSDSRSAEGFWAGSQLSSGRYCSGVNFAGAGRSVDSAGEGCA